MNLINAKHFWLIHLIIVENRYQHFRNTVKFERN